MFLGIDIGTSSTKAAVIDGDLRVVARASANHPLSCPRSGWAEQDPVDWWTSAADATRAVVAQVGAAAIERLAVSGQGAALVLIDEAGMPLKPALIHLDQRAAAQASALDASPFGDAMREARGGGVAAWNVAAKLAWTQRHEPQTFAAVRGVTSAAGFVLARLTGRLVQSVSDAGISDLFDLRTRTWSWDLARELELDPDQLPDIIAATSDAGSLAPAAAEALGLRPGVAVAGGGEDTSSAAVAAGVATAGDAYLSLGTTGVVGIAMPAGTVAPSRLLRFPHVCEALDLLSGSMTSAGAAIAWWADVTGRSASDLLAEADARPHVDETPTFVPYLAGELHPINDPHARGVFFGLSLATSRADITRAIVEGSAGAIAHNLEAARELDAVPSRLFACGRPSRSRIWMQAVADATGLPVEVVSAGEAEIGDALIAASRSDDDLALCARGRGRGEARFEPDPMLCEELAARAAARHAVHAALSRAPGAGRGTVGLPTTDSQAVDP